MRRLLRVIIVSGIVFAALLLVVAGTGVFVVRHSFPSYDGTVALTGLDAEVEVVRDGNGIPQIYADKPGDLFAAQGYVHAQDRFFEMDFRRHVTAGRLAELFGKDALETDKFVRTLGWRRVAEKELGLLAPTTRQYLDDYARGVNAYLGTHAGSGLSLEYAVLSLKGTDYRPEPWTAADSLAWLKAMAWDLGGNMDDEITRTKLAAKYPVSNIASLYPDYPYDRNEPIVATAAVTKGGTFTTAPVDTEARRGMLTKDLLKSLDTVGKVAKGLPELLGRGDGIGSNAWVVSGEHTTTGKPLLANDPHLGATMPGIWSQVGLHCNNVSTRCPYDVSGFSFSGLPGVVIGHNAAISWGFTNLDPDVMDLYLEKFSGPDAVVYDNKVRALSKREETFKVAGQDEVEKITVRESRHGPIISDVGEDERETGELAAKRLESPEAYGVALQWTALTPGRTADALFAINRAQTWKAFRAAAAQFEVPSQNLVYADREGHIGYQAPGRIPIRNAGDGDWPVPGWDSRYHWKGYIPFEAMPTEADPDDGIIVTANQAVVPQSYPYHLTDDWDYGHRAQQILDRIRGAGKLDANSMASIQLDTKNRNAETLVPYLLQVQISDEFDRQGQDTLRNWDFTQPADSAPAAYFNVVWRNLLALTFHDQLPEGTWPDGGSRWFEVMRKVIMQPNSAWWDNVTTTQRESRDDVLRDALVKARAEITTKMARDPGSWQWGRLHKLTLTNQTLGKSGIGVVDKMFNRGPYELGGGSSLVNATSWDASKDYTVTATPSMRMVVDLSDFDKSRWINMTGVSGHAYTSNYTDQTDLWVRGETLPWAFTRGAVEATREHTLTFTKPEN
ncbi:penicillin acylase family protein [Kribbella sp. CA-293567]|uniref:penicillin acylase family protein n=1 Tax=Kribbella sp. CA-293567 TaxID=3002436 RepID=UPI0022DDB815|nr:penicillin acylase family protein [Kribbella sp. CA-293567]WBQ06710.1 penicillin acylase family protein [Kribbella sp. CA-293567]